MSEPAPDYAELAKAEAAAAMRIINDSCIEAVLFGEVGTGRVFWPAERSIRLGGHLRRLRTYAAMTRA